MPQTTSDDTSTLRVVLPMSFVNEVGTWAEAASLSL